MKRSFYQITNQNIYCVYIIKKGLLNVLNDLNKNCFLNQRNHFLIRFLESSSFKTLL